MVGRFGNEGMSELVVMGTCGQDSSHLSRLASGDQDVQSLTFKAQPHSLTSPAGSEKFKKHRQLGNKCFPWVHVTLKP